MEEEKKESLVELNPILKKNDLTLIEAVKKLDTNVILTYTGMAVGMYFLPYLIGLPDADRNLFCNIASPVGIILGAVYISHIYKTRESFRVNTFKLATIWVLAVGVLYLTAKQLGY